MKRKSIADLAKEKGWEASTHKIDAKFEFKLIEFLRDSIAPQPAQTLATHFRKEVREVEYYLDRLGGQNLAQYIPIKPGQWGWVAIKLEKN
jgi:hypothetical protein